LRQDLALCAFILLPFNAAEGGRAKIFEESVDSRGLIFDI
jgi:hypothetical protein